MKNKFILIIIIALLVFGGVYINYVSYAGMQDVYGASVDETNQQLFNKVKRLQNFAENYKKENNISTSTSQLCMQFIRREKYNSNAWKLMVGNVDENFVSYVKSKDSSFNITTNDKLIDKKTGYEIDFIHMMATLNAYVKPNGMIDKSYAGWAGDLMTLLEEVVKYRSTNNIIDTNEIQKYSNSLLGTTLKSSFGRSDALADLDAINLSLYSNINSDLYQVLVDYYINNTGNNCSFTRFENAQVQLGNSRSAVKTEAKNRLSNSLMQGQLLSNDIRSIMTSDDIDILANSFVEYVYREPYFDYVPSSVSIFVAIKDSIELSGRNIDNVILSYDKDYLSVNIEENYLHLNGIKNGTSDISIYTKDNVLKGTIRVVIKNVAPSITTNLESTTTLRIGINNSVRFSAGGTNNVYKWYVLNSKTDSGTLLKTTDKPELGIIVNNFDLNNKYIKCSVSNDGNNEIFTNISKISVKDAVPSIKTNPPSSVSIESGTSKTISFTAGGSNNVYTWYLSNSASVRGSVYKTTSKPEITLSPTNFDLTGKYLVCGISNTGNNEVFTSPIALNITDTKATITADLPSSVTITIGSRSALNFVATGTNNIYNWYVSSKTSEIGKLYKSTVEPQLTLAPTNFDLNNKYITCEIKNAGNKSVYTRSVKVIIKDVAPVIFSDLPSNVNMVTNKESKISFSAGGTNNKYTWYLSSSESIKGSVYKTTTTPDLTLTATKDLNGKYLSCEISNTGNSSVTTKSLKLNVSDKISVINVDLPNSTNMILGTNTLLAFSVNVKAEKYVWYLSNSSTNKGTVYKTTTKPEISISPVSDLNGKYLRCGVITDGNPETFTSSVKLNVKLEAPIIKTDLPTSSELTLNVKKTLSFKVSGVQNKYTWYLTDSPKKTGTVLEITKSPSITFTPTIDMHNKYLVCEVRNSDENVVKTNYVRLAIKSVNNKPVIPEDNENNDESNNNNQNNENITTRQDDVITSTMGDDDNNKPSKKLPSYVYLIIEFVVFIIILNIILSALDNSDKDKKLDEGNKK